jgi:hypothetical protein
VGKRGKIPGIKLLFCRSIVGARIPRPTAYAINNNPSKNDQDFPAMLTDYANRADVIALSSIDCELPLTTIDRKITI